MKNKLNIRWQLVLYDVLVLIIVDVLLLALSESKLSVSGIVIQGAIGFVAVFASRLSGSIYRQIWRYGGIQCYIRLFFTDAIAFVVTLIVERILPIEHISFSRLLSISCMNLLGALTMRMMYRYAFKCGNDATLFGKVLLLVLKIFAGSKIVGERTLDATKINIAIIGAGRVGASLAEELLNNAGSAYTPRCFVDVSKEKVGRDIHGIPVLLEDEATLEQLKRLNIQEVVFAIPNLADDKKKSLYEHYQKAGYKIKVYDYPTMQTVGGKRHLREFDIEELLFRRPIVVNDEQTSEYYRDKVILITGGGGSIGSELCRQLAKMQPKQIVILDIYENGAYDVQQELKIAYAGKLDVRIEIISITHKKALEKVFRTYHPQIVINAAAHKHVPLMEHNCVEAVQNNVFGTKNVIDCCEEYGAERFMMVSTDKAVNPTNVMGATKRMCEMLVQSASTHGKVTYSATRFGNVLGSAGSVIPLFKRQIANGGPITLTDKRIIRYFMTIPEASQLVLASGAMAHNGELFVLDMGQPVRILDLAENMIRLSGVQGVEIVETGLRPGEKLYEELLVKTGELDKTDNSLIFVERDTPLSEMEINEKLKMLQRACETEDDDFVRDVLKQVVPTFKKPEEVNVKANESDEMKNQRKLAVV
ncbi:polysaccharide biosynthesis protein [Pseudoflavonifractor capillosus]|uniref:nucleoside-diphosphate sugar epimerase/dehydratase n=1 Tax=Pseudoflavonifractor capillosus TaxID=106588 RepID=UPI0019561DAB|nr:nucleoside-diphosphate sugar epimerase/dehydratase [Pseudoflavonifractor capillosus]MBM6693268.1 polysaccharide biosynthesis protein [Pseudoflavonifractor capillosus]